MREQLGTLVPAEDGWEALVCHSRMPLVLLGGETICLFYLTKSFIDFTDRPFSRLGLRGGYWKVCNTTGGRGFSGCHHEHEPEVGASLTCFVLWWCCCDFHHGFSWWLTKNIEQTPCFCSGHPPSTLHKIYKVYRRCLILSSALLNVLKCLSIALGINTYILIMADKILLALSPAFLISPATWAPFACWNSELPGHRVWVGQTSCIRNALPPTPGALAPSSDLCANIVFREKAYPCVRPGPCSSIELGSSLSEHLLQFASAL